MLQITYKSKQKGLKKNARKSFQKWRLVTCQVVVETNLIIGEALKQL